MRPDLTGIVDFLRAAERLKATPRSGYTSAGRPESVAEHTWRLCLMALVLAPEFPDADFAKLVKICIVHDLGEAIGGDVVLWVFGEIDVDQVARTVEQAATLTAEMGEVKSLSTCFVLFR